MVEAAGDRERYEVFTADQARLILGTSHGRSVSEAARRREQNGGSPVYWDNKDPGNPTAVQLFDAAWVIERALDHDGVHTDLEPLLVPLQRRAGMTLRSCRVRIDRADEPAVVDGEMAARLAQSEQVLDGYRREAQTERDARQEAEINRLHDEVRRLRAELAARGAVIGRLTRAVDDLSGVGAPQP